MNSIAMLRCICDETRFGILKLLKNEELCVSDLASAMKKDQPLISHHLKTLKKCGIVKSKASGKKRLYGISNRQMRDLIVRITQASKKIPTQYGDSECR